MNTALWTILSGTTPILVTAPHSAQHIRDNAIKLREIGTAELTQELCGLTGCWGGFTTQPQKDPNWHEDAPFRKRIAKLVAEEAIAAVLDLHGKGDSITELMEFQPNHTFQHEFSGILPDYPVLSFKDDGQITISEMLDDMGIPAVQIEISRKGRNNNTVERDNILGLLSEIIGDISQDQNT